MSLPQFSRATVATTSEDLHASPLSSINHLAETSSLRVRLACNSTDRDAVYGLRYQVFNVELGEGLKASCLSERDCDVYDTVCEHLLVEDIVTGEVVGTYRMQSGLTAGAHFGYYSEREFHFAPYEHLRPQMLEIGRACIRKDYRALNVLMLLWRGIVLYATQVSARYVIGCSSLNSTDVSSGSAMFATLRERFLVEPELQTAPTEEFSLQIDTACTERTDPPRLLKSYLSVGAKICGPPALDREFGTIDFLTLVDTEQLTSAARSRFFAC